MADSKRLFGLTVDEQSVQVGYLQVRFGLKRRMIR